MIAKIKRKGVKLWFRDSDKGGLEYSEDKGQMWYLTMRTWSEVKRTHVYPPFSDIEWSDDDGNPKPLDTTNQEDAEREVFGETLDEEIPDDLWAMIQG